jgi:hypothetical protein
MADFLMTRATAATSGPEVTSSTERKSCCTRYSSPPA